MFEYESLYPTEETWLNNNGFKTHRKTLELWRKRLIATKNLLGGKIRILGVFLPAHCFYVKVYNKNKSKVTFETGSGNLAEYMEVLMPVIKKFLENMILISEG